MNAFDSLILLSFFAPLALMVGLNIALYRAERYTVQPPFRAGLNTPRGTMAVEADEYELRKAA